MTVAGREWLVAVMPVEPDGLGMVMLRYADELRDPAGYFEDVPTEKPDKEMVDLAVELIERKSGNVQAGGVREPLPHGAEGAGRPEDEGPQDHAPHEDAAPRGKVVDLMSALRKSIGEAPAKPKVKAGGAPAERRQSAGRAKR